MSSITVSELNQLLQQGIGEDVLLIDVRSPGEHHTGKIPSVINMPLEELEKYVDEIKQYKTVYIHCQSGNRSQKACEKFNTLGINNYVNVVGGLTAWQQAGFSIDRPKGTLPMMQQVMIAAGSLVLIGLILAQFLNGTWMGLSAFVGVGLLYAGLSGNCLMSTLLAKMPWNHNAASNALAAGADCQV